MSQANEASKIYSYLFLSPGGILMQWLVAPHAHLVLMFSVTVKN
jgi:hypothetical protein